VDRPLQAAALPPIERAENDEPHVVAADPAEMAIDPLPVDWASYRGGVTKHPLVVVSNRVTPAGGARPDSGGLAVAIRSALQESGGIWFGWSGAVTEEPPGEPGITVDGPLTFATLDLSRRDYDEYYIGFCQSCSLASISLPHRTSRVLAALSRWLFTR
jgi:hypothetical protein